jgi:hypothetical protein
MEQPKLRKRQRNSRNDWETQLPGNGACQSSHNCVATWFPSVRCSITRVSDSFVSQEGTIDLTMLPMLPILFLCSYSSKSLLYMTNATQTTRTMLGRNNWFGLGYNFSWNEGVWIQVKLFHSFIFIQYKRLSLNSHSRTDAPYGFFS